MFIRLRLCLLPWRCCPTTYRVLQVLGPRRRKQVDYCEANLGNRSASSSSYHTGNEEDAEEGDEVSRAKGLKRAAEGDAQHGAKKAKKKVGGTSWLCQLCCQLA